MLISPPFLNPSATASANPVADAKFVDDCMLGVTGREGTSGMYPISYELGWHGGVHLSARLNATTVLPVRAIADGVLCYKKIPSKEPATPNKAAQDAKDARPWAIAAAGRTTAWSSSSTRLPSVRTQAARK